MKGKWGRRLVVQYRVGSPVESYQEWSNVPGDLPSAAQHPGATPAQDESTPLAVQLTRAGVKEKSHDAFAFRDQCCCESVIPCFSCSGHYSESEKRTQRCPIAHARWSARPDHHY